ncbi:hypothetical protein BG015_001416 [Linnemannia schmuckeri]|uniref:Galactose oxidase n=1 Tax=Linnemannia schmuckeri TaxID=64567 RepID=A0A9P5RQ90_9FUNG|nr:hypothetical protein BG015_001416 [Linnemannia schmuckeri]
MISAQAPASTYGMAYATIDESTMYIQGGITLPPPGGTAKLTPQFYALDLTQDWNVTNPSWKALTPPSNAVSQISSQSMTVSPDRQTLTVWSVFPTVALNYSVSNASWTKAPLSAGLIISGAGLHAATDPTTGAVYIPGTGPLNSNYMVRYNYVTGLINLINIPLTLVAALDHYSFVWCQPRKTFILFAGNASSVNAFSEYSPSTSQWTQLVSSGPTPSFRRRSCMVPAYNGTKMILFGGDGSGPSVASISILDIPTMTWTNGKDAPDARSEMACSVAGDNFIVWGGYKEMLSVDSVPVPATPLIYNIKTGKWTDKFVRGTNGNKTEGGGGGSGNGSGGKSGSGSGGGSVGGGVGPIVGGGQNTGTGDIASGGVTATNGAAIGGGVAVAVGVIAGITFLFIQRRRQRSTKDFEMVLPNMSTVPPPIEDRPRIENRPPIENWADRPASNEYYQNKLNQQQQQQQEMFNSNVQYISRNEPPGVSGSPPSYSASSRCRPAVPSYYDATGITGDPRELVRQLSR